VNLQIGVHDRKSLQGWGAVPSQYAPVAGPFTAEREKPTMGEDADDRHMSDEELPEDLFEILFEDGSSREGDTEPSFLVAFWVPQCRLASFAATLAERPAVFLLPRLAPAHPALGPMVWVLTFPESGPLVETLSNDLVVADLYASSEDTYEDDFRMITMRPRPWQHFPVLLFELTTPDEVIADRIDRLVISGDWEMIKLRTARTLSLAEDHETTIAKFSWDMEVNTFADLPGFEDELQGSVPDWRASENLRCLMAAARHLVAEIHSEIHPEAEEMIARLLGDLDAPESQGDAPLLGP
jgi:hypothetical protein